LHATQSLLELLIAVLQLLDCSRQLPHLIFELIEPDDHIRRRRLGKGWTQTGDHNADERRQREGPNSVAGHGRSQNRDTKKRRQHWSNLRPNCD